MRDSNRTSVPEKLSGIWLDNLLERGVAVEVGKRLDAGLSPLVALFQRLYALALFPEVFDRGLDLDRAALLARDDLCGGAL
jgi:hypothetical protein